MLVKNLQVLYNYMSCVIKFPRVLADKKEKKSHESAFENAVWPSNYSKPRNKAFVNLTVIIFIGSAEWDEPSLISLISSLPVLRHSEGVVFHFCT